MDDFRENVIEFVQNDKTATVTFCQGRFISRIKELAEKFPEECQITAENSDGSIVAHIPTKWVRINPTKQLSEEQLENLRVMAKNNFHSTSDSTDV